MPARDALARVIARRGVKVVFGLLGRANVPLVAAIQRARGLSYVGARHENGAISMADGYARSTGGLGVVTVTGGPGVTNGLTALIEAARAGTALVAITADGGPRRTDGQHLDLARLGGALELAVMPVRGAATADEDLDRATARALRAGEPVLVPVPLAVYDGPCPGIDSLEEIAAQPATNLPAGGALIEATEALCRASRPVIVIGRGVRDEAAAAPIGRLADRIGALVTTTMHAAGLCSDHALYAGTAGVHARPEAAALLAEADLVLAFGASLNRFTTRAGHLFPAAGAIVQCNIDPAAAARPPATLAVVGDATACARALLEELERRGANGPGFRGEDVRKRLARRPATAVPGANGRLRDATCVLDWLDRSLPLDRRVVCDTGHGTGVALARLSVYGPRRAVHPFFFQAIGLAPGMAIGAACASPGSTVVLVLGDGALMMSLGELETMVRQRLRVLVVVINDAAYGAELRELEQRGEHVGIARTGDVDFAAAARGLGARGVSVAAMEDLAEVQSWIDGGAGTCLLDCKVDPGVAADWFIEAIGGPAAYLKEPRGRE